MKQNQYSSGTFRLLFAKHTRQPSVVESHSECLKKSQDVFEDQEETIITILNDSVKKNEIFEDTNYKMKYAQDSLEKQTNKKFEDLENKVRTFENGSGDFKGELEKVRMFTLG